MSQTGTPTEFLKLGITEPDDTLNVLVDLNGQWRKIDTGVKNVDTKANTNASGISALNTAVQDNTENITNILETNVNQQNSIDTLQTKVATLEQDDTDYGTRITAVEAGVQENSELINDLEVDLSGVKTDMGTVPSGSTLQGQVDGLDTRVDALETEVGTVPSGSTVQGQITTLNGQVNSGNIPFRFSVDGGGNYGYLKADDSFVPFSSGSPTSLGGHDITYYNNNHTGVVGYQSSFYLYRTTDSTSPLYKKVLYIPTLTLVDVSSFNPDIQRSDLYSGNGEVLYIEPNYFYYDRNTNDLVQLPNTTVCACSDKNSITYYTKETNQYTLHYLDLLDNANNFNKVFTLPSDKYQSTSTGRQGMLFQPHKTNTLYHSYFSYYSNTALVNVGENNGNIYIESTTVNSKQESYAKDRYLLEPDNYIMKPTGSYLDGDKIYYINYYRYIKVGDYYIDCL